MKWKNIHVDGMPKHSQEVLVSIEGVFHLTWFDLENKIFRSTQGMGLHFPVSKKSQIFWMELAHPDRES